MGANAANDLFLHMGHILPMGSADLRSDDAPDGKGQGKYRKGQLGYVMDDYGLRIFRYLRNMKGAAALQGGLYSRVADVNVTLGATSGSTTTVIKKAASWTANTLVGRMYVHLGNATTPGAAPEGETSIVVANDANSVTLDAARPLSAAPSVGADTTRVISLFDYGASATGDLASGAGTNNVSTPNVMGIAMIGVTNGNWGVLQTYGTCPDAKVQPSTAIGIGPLVAHTEQLTVAPTTTLVTAKLVVGSIYYAIAATNASGFATVFLNVHSGVQPINSL
jgi:hypothetical protein